MPAIASTDPTSGVPASIAPLQSLLLGGQTTDLSRPSPQSGSQQADQSLSDWSQPSAQQIRQAAAKLQPASPDAENAVLDLAAASHQQAVQWQRESRSPALPDGSLDPQFVEEVVQEAPEAAAVLVGEQAAANIPADERLSIGEAVALGVTTQRTIPARQVRQGVARAIKTAGRDGDLEAALQGELGIGTEAAFGRQAERVEEVAQQMHPAAPLPPGPEQF